MSDAPRKKVRAVRDVEPILDGVGDPCWVASLSCGHIVILPARWAAGVVRPKAHRNPRADELVPAKKRAACAACSKHEAPAAEDPEDGHTHVPLIALGGGVLVEQVVDGQPVCRCACLGAPGFCVRCLGTGTNPPTLPTELVGDWVLGYWFSCSGVGDIFTVVARRAWGWVAAVRAIHHETNDARTHVLRPPTSWGPEQVAAQQDNAHDAAMRRSGLKAWGVRVDVRSAIPSVVADRWSTFAGACGGHLVPPSAGE